MLYHPRFITNYDGVNYFAGEKGIYRELSGLFVFVPEKELPLPVLSEEMKTLSTRRKLSELIEQKEKSGTWCHDGATLTSLRKYYY